MIMNITHLKVHNAHSYPSVDLKYASNTSVIKKVSCLHSRFYSEVFEAYLRFSVTLICKYVIDMGRYRPMHL